MTETQEQATMFKWAAKATEKLKAEAKSVSGQILNRIFGGRK